LPGIVEVNSIKTRIKEYIEKGDCCIYFISVNEDKTNCPQFYFEKVKRVKASNCLSHKNSTLLFAPDYPICLAIFLFFHDL
jgi:hypothetical protein